MNELNLKEKFFNREKNVDALFGFVHIKDKPVLHQRAAQHIFGENDSAIVVPLNVVRGVWDQQESRVRQITKIALLSLVVVGIIAFSVYLFRQDPGLLIPFM